MSLVHAARIARGGASFDMEAAACRDHKGKVPVVTNPDSVTCKLCLSRLGRFPQLRNAMATIARGEALAKAG